MRIHCLIVSFLFLSGLSYGQLDSLQVHNLNEQLEQAEVLIESLQFDGLDAMLDEIENTLVDDEPDSIYFKTQYLKGLYLVRQEKHPEAVEVFKKILSEVKASDYYEYKLMTRLYDKLAVSYDRIGDLTQALSTFFLYLEEVKNQVPEKREYAIDVAKAYNNIAVNLYHALRYELSDLYFDSALIELHKHNPQPTKLEHVIYMNKGAVNDDLGYVVRGKQFHERSIDLMYQLPMSPIAKAIAWNYYAIHLIQNAASEKDLKEVIAYTDSAKHYYGRHPFAHYTNTIYGRALGRLGDYEAAISYAEKAVKGTIELYGNEHPDLIEAYILWAKYAIKDDQPALAKKCLNNAMDQFHEIDPEMFPLKSQVYTQWGNYYQSIDQLPQALEAYQQGIQVLLPDFDYKNILDNPSPDRLINRGYLYDLLAQKAEVLSMLYKQTDSLQYLEAQLSCYELMIGKINLGSRELAEAQSSLSLNELKHDVYVDAVDAAMSAYERSSTGDLLERIFSYVSKSKANRLHEKIERSRLKDEHLPASLKQLFAKQADQKRTIERLENYLFYLSEDERNLIGDSINLEIFKAKESHRLISDQLRKAHDISTSDLNFDSVSWVTLGQSLGANDVLQIEFFDTEDNLMVLYLGDRMGAFRLKVDEGLTNLLTRYIQGLHQGKFDKQSSLQLYKLLIEPVLTATEFSGDRIHIIPSGQLSNLPFESLVTDNNQIPGYLLQDYIISYNLSSIRSRSDNLKKDFKLSKFAGFSPSFGTTQVILEHATRSGNNMDLDSLTPLPHARHEVITISDMLTGNSYVDQLASEHLFKENAVSADYLHIASHAIVEYTDPLYSRVLFHPEDSLEDGLAHAYELYNMNINSDLVTLSACNTGFGPYQKGEGVMSLANSFIYAGAKNVITSLWAVPDKSTSEIMVRFYGHLKDGLPKAEALRMAKVDYLKNADRNTSNPYFWAGFVLIGEVDEPEASRGLTYWGAGILLLIILVILAVTRRKNASNS